MKIVTLHQIIIGIMNADEHRYLSKERLQHFFSFAYTKLRKLNIQQDYQVSLNMNGGDLDYFVDANSTIYFSDFNKKYIFIRTNIEMDKMLQRYSLDQTFGNIVKKFVKENPL